MAYLDLPAVIDYVYKEIGNKKLSYIGHSQGTTQMFMGMARDKQFYKERVDVFVALAPGIIPTKPAD